MTDEDVARSRRDLAMAPGDPHARAEALQAMVRSGLVAQERLELLAHAMDPGAMLAVPCVCARWTWCHVHHQDAVGQDAWLMELPRFGPHAVAAAVLAAGREAQSAWLTKAVMAAGAHIPLAFDESMADTLARYLGDRVAAPVRLLQTIEEWAACPCAEHARAAQEAERSLGVLERWATSAAKALWHVALGGGMTKSDVHVYWAVDAACEETGDQAPRQDARHAVLEVALAGVDVPTDDR